MNKPTSARSYVVGRACNLIEEWVGIRLSGAAPHRLHEFLGRRAATLGLADAGAYVDHVADLAIDAPEARRLINLVTNGLTAFWRDEPQLDAVRLALKDLSTKRDRPLNVWCAGCATGEETYTISMLAKEANLDTHILGTDINTDFLRLARQGVYGEWSLRRLNSRRISTHFIEHEGQYEIHPELRRSVAFQRHNLLHAAPEPPMGKGWDVILCRNVLIYFVEETTQRAILRFAEVLDPEGYLMLGSSEQLSSYYPPEIPGPFRAARHGAGFVYRLAATPPGATVYNLPTLTEEDSSLEAFRELSRPAISLSDLSEQTVELEPEQVVQEMLETGVDHLGWRDRESALACFEAAAGYDPFIPETYYLIGVMLSERAPQRAMETLRKALFLNPLHWLAAFELARLYEATGERPRACQTYRQCLEGIAAGPELFDSETLEEMFAPNASRIAQIMSACEDALKRLRAS